MNWWHRKTINFDVLLMWVLALLLAGVFVLWAVVGRAETGFVSVPLVSDGAPCDSGAAAANPRTGETFGCEHGQWVRLRLPCEQKMEAAMRAMDEFIDRPDDVHNTEAVLLPTVASKQWDAVKKECWREK